MYLPNLTILDEVRSPISVKSGTNARSITTIEKAIFRGFLVKKLFIITPPINHQVNDFLL